MLLTIPSAPLNPALSSSLEPLGTALLTLTCDPPDSDGNSPILGYTNASPILYDVWSYFDSSLSTTYSESRQVLFAAYSRRGVAASNAVGQGPYSAIATTQNVTDKYTITRVVGSPFTYITIAFDQTKMPAPPLWSSQSGEGDARNPATWNFWGPSFPSGVIKLVSKSDDWTFTVSLGPGGDAACAVFTAPIGLRLTNGDRFWVGALFRDLAPAAPVVDSVTGFEGGLSVTFTPATPSPIYPSPPSEFVHEYSIDGGLTTYIANATGSTFEITGLSGGSPINVQMRACCGLSPGSGWEEFTVGPWSNVLSGTPIAPPTPPTPDWAPYRAMATGNRSVRVEFDPNSYAAPPYHASSTGLKDATNPRSWAVIQTFVDSSSPAGDYKDILSVVAVSPWIYDLALLQPFKRQGAAVYRPIQNDTVHVGNYLDISASLKLEDGTTTGVITYATIALAATDVNPNAQATARGFTQRDLTNASISPAGTLAGGTYSEFLSGTLLINSAGDYTSQSGEALVRKLIMRRLISKKGDFFHLPEYGAGLGINETFSTANLRTMAKDIEMQVLQEPEIERAKATLTYQAASASLIVQVQARMRSTGQETALSFSLPLAGSTQF